MIIPLALALTFATMADSKQSPSAQEPNPVQFYVKVTILEVEGNKELPSAAVLQDGESLSSFLNSLDWGASLKVIVKPNLRTISGFPATINAQISSETTAGRVDINSSLAVTPTALSDGSISMDMNLTLSRPSVDASGNKTTLSTSSHIVSRLSGGHNIVLRAGKEIIVLTPKIVQQQ